ncbi:hypothetical protein CBR_g19531 [Chara braunii]|uniref:Uncharacterized protein n=1 Tax=Chara braunii TaxID=69332 RepID=A0A388KY76_CHABU|nr:hypothetical protein CBR_g19531 [Chara braunii]|eukprot:GBG75016.1 hypothetical protein CBR_g19531 [Chara braunii]
MCLAPTIRRCGSRVRSIVEGTVVRQLKAAGLGAWNRTMSGMVFKETMPMGMDQMVASSMEEEPTQIHIYFLEVGTLVGPSGVLEDEEEQPGGGCAKALEETKGSELVMACDRHCSRVLELVLSCVEPTELVEFGLRTELRRGLPHSHLLADEPALQSGWVQMSLNACSSDISQTAKAKEKRKAENHRAKLVAMLELLCNKLGDSAEWLISNKYGLHVLRTSIQLLICENSDRDGDAHGRGRKPKESTFAGLAAKLHHAQKGLGVDAVSNGANTPGGGVEAGGNKMTVLRVVVLILSRGSQEHLSSSVEGRQLEGTDAELVRDMVRDMSGSHVVEAILKLVSDALFLEIFLRFFHGMEEVPLMWVMGCVILQSVFQCPPECCQVFLDAIERLGPDILKATARDPGGSRVLEAYLKSGAPQKSKGNVIAELKGHFGELAAVPAGSHCVKRCYFTGDMKQKEMIAAELAQGRLRGSITIRMMAMRKSTTLGKQQMRWREPSSRKDEIEMLFSRKHAKRGLHEGVNRSVDEGGRSADHVTTSGRTSEHWSPTKKKGRSIQQSEGPMSKEAEREEEDIDVKETTRKNTGVDASMSKIVSAIQSLKGPKKRSSKDTSAKEGKTFLTKRRKAQFVMS